LTEKGEINDGKGCPTVKRVMASRTATLGIYPPDSSIIGRKVRTGHVRKLAQQ